LNATNSDFGDERVRSPSPAFGGAGLASAAASPPREAKLKRILMLSGEFNFFFLEERQFFCEAGRRFAAAGGGSA